MDGREGKEIQIAEYDELWEAAFISESEILRATIREYIVGGIEHVGSTSVSGLAAKPIVDIQVGVAGLKESRSAFSDLEAIGYNYDSVHPNEMHFFDKRESGIQPINLQLIPFRSDCWNKRIAFRDYLRAHPAVACEYAELKRDLARRFPLDSLGYTAGKSDYIRTTVRQAMGVPR